MSTKADKGEIEQSPMKKKFRDSAISSEDLDSAIASRIELAFKEHQSTLNSVVNSAVRDAMDSRFKVLVYLSHTQSYRV